MKKTVLLVAGSLLLLSSCTTKNEGGMSETAKKNLETARKISNAFQTGNASVVDSVVAPDFVDHTDRGDMNRDSLKAMIAMANAMDMKMEPIRELATDDFVYQWYRFTGTSDGSMMPAGPYDFTEIEAVRFKDGKIVEHWAFMEPRDMMKLYMPQGMPDASNKPTTDTTK